jgi:hypothetical protein
VLAHGEGYIILREQALEQPAGREASEGPMETPCVDICEIDRETGLCRGCGRSIAEISSWASMTGAERRRIMAELSRRMAALVKG